MPDGPQLCSLREKQDRLAMSVVWKMDAETYEVKDVWFGPTIIHSSHELHYQLAQDIIDGVSTQ